jgi:SAM-dependent methyltransferase
LEDDLEATKRRERLPGFLPKWVKERVEVNVYLLNRWVHRAGQMVPAQARFLDAGAGEGRFRHEFSHTCYTGVDLAIGDVVWDYSGLDAIATLTELPFPDGTFEASICTQVLEHVTEPYLVLKEIYRTLKPGGRIFLAAPQSWHQHQKPHDYFRYTSFGFRYLLEKCGFQVESMEPLGGYFWFLSFQLQNFNYWVFSHRKHGRTWITLPLRAFFGFTFQLGLPLILFYLDGLDPVKDETFGFACIATKPGAPASP